MVLWTVLVTVVLLDFAKAKLFSESLSIHRSLDGVGSLDDLEGLLEKRRRLILENVKDDPVRVAKDMNEMEKRRKHIPDKLKHLVEESVELQDAHLVWYNPLSTAIDGSTLDVNASGSWMIISSTGEKLQAFGTTLHRFNNRRVQGRGFRFDGKILLNNVEGKRNLYASRVREDMYPHRGEVHIVYATVSFADSEIGSTVMSFEQLKEDVELTAESFNNQSRGLATFTAHGVDLRFPHNGSHYADFPANLFMIWNQLQEALAPLLLDKPWHDYELQIISTCTNFGLGGGSYGQLLMWHGGGGGGEGAQYFFRHEIGHGMGLQHGAYRGMVNVDDDLMNRYVPGLPWYSPERMVGLGWFPDGTVTTVKRLEHKIVEVAAYDNTFELENRTQQYAVRCIPYPELPTYNFRGYYPLKHPPLAAHLIIGARDNLESRKGIHLRLLLSDIKEKTRRWAQAKTAEKYVDLRWNAIFSEAVAVNPQNWDQKSIQDIGDSSLYRMGKWVIRVEILGRRQTAQNVSKFKLAVSIEDVDTQMELLSTQINNRFTQGNGAKLIRGQNESSYALPTRRKCSPNFGEHVASECAGSTVSHGTTCELFCETGYRSENTSRQFTKCVDGEFVGVQLECLSHPQTFDNDNCAALKFFLVPSDIDDYFSAMLPGIFTYSPEEGSYINRYVEYDKLSQIYFWAARSQLKKTQGTKWTAMFRQMILKSDDTDHPANANRWEKIREDNGKMWHVAGDLKIVCFPKIEQACESPPPLDSGMEQLQCSSGLSQTNCDVICSPGYARFSPNRMARGPTEDFAFTCSAGNGLWERGTVTCVSSKQQTLFYVDGPEETGAERVTFTACSRTPVDSSIALSLYAGELTAVQSQHFGFNLALRVSEYKVNHDCSQLTANIMPRETFLLQMFSSSDSIDLSLERTVLSSIPQRGMVLTEEGKAPSYFVSTPYFTSDSSTVLYFRESVTEGIHTNVNSLGIYDAYIRSDMRIETPEKAKPIEVCGELRWPEGGYTSCGPRHVVENGTCTVFCHTGFYLEDEEINTVTCHPNGSFSFPQPRCVKRCDTVYHSFSDSYVTGVYRLRYDLYETFPNWQIFTGDSWHLVRLPVAPDDAHGKYLLEQGQTVRHNWIWTQDLLSDSYGFVMAMHQDRQHPTNITNMHYWRDGGWKWTEEQTPGTIVRCAEFQTSHVLLLNNSIWRGAFVRVDELTYQHATENIWLYHAFDSYNVDKFFGYWCLDNDRSVKNGCEFKSVQTMIPNPANITQDWGLEISDPNCRENQFFNASTLECTDCPACNGELVGCRNVSPGVCTPKPKRKNSWTWLCDCDMEKGYDVCLRECQEFRGDWGWTCQRQFESTQFTYPSEELSNAKSEMCAVEVS